MGLITYDDLEDGTPITANIFNERFGQIIAQLNGGLDQNNFASGGIPVAALSTGVFEKMYPVGSLYFNSIDNTNPGTLLGLGTWIAYASGRVPVGYDSTDTDFNAAEKTGGHKLMQAHTHTLPGAVNIPSGASYTVPSVNVNTPYPTSSTGGGDSENLQPFITVYIWKRQS